MSNLFDNFGTRVSLCAAVTALALLFVLMLVVTQPVEAQTFKVIHTFTQGADGSVPLAGLSIDRAGNLYGTASLGGYKGGLCGAGGCGTVFKVGPTRSGWLFTLLYQFQANGDGQWPANRAVLGPDRSVYATATSAAGSVINLTPPLTPSTGILSLWSERTIFQFNSYDGQLPKGDLVFDHAGNLWGSVAVGMNGPCYEGCGGVYELTRSNGGWVQTIVHQFQDTPDGASPQDGLVFDNAGNAYGTTLQGGANGCGTIFRLRPSRSGWAEDILHDLSCGSEGGNPTANLILDVTGNLFGTTSTGGTEGAGTIFELSPSNGNWVFTVLYNPTSLASPLVFDAAGNIYGATLWGGPINSTCPSGCGTIFKLTPSGGAWAYSPVYNFSGGSDGAFPYASLVFDPSGNMYGTASGGGIVNQQRCGGGCGVVFEITP